MRFSRRYMMDLFRERGWSFFTMGDFNTNLVFVRKSLLFSNRFDDELRIYFKENSTWVEIVIPFSTKAGVFKGKTGIYEPITHKGITGMAVMKEGFYRGAYQLTDNYWNWLSYPFLQQVGEIEVYRDNTRDLIIDKNSPVQRGAEFECHIHRAGSIGVFETGVFRYSIGCLVTPSPYLNLLLRVCREAVKVWGNRFSIALIEDL